LAKESTVKKLNPCVSPASFDLSLQRDAFKLRGIQVGNSHNVLDGKGITELNPG